ncbi:MAG TPA: tetratricopeptide repeat protein [Candidatus Saccharimonadales bacterium]|nr:tetratricopeptide repeat protein [Candidatus Saccharimonadales bacterium]
MKAFKFILIGGLGGTLLAGCSSPGHSQASATADEGGNRMVDGAADLSSPRIAKGNPTALAHFAAGVTYELNEQDELAVKQFDQSALADPSNETLVIELAQRFLHNKQTDKALTLLEKSGRRVDASALVLSWLARADLQAGQTNRALEASRLAIKRQPEALDGYESELEILFQENQLAEASRVLNRAAKSIRPDPPGLVALAGLYSIYLKAQPKDLDAKARAVALLDRVAKMNFAAPQLWQRVADSYSHLDEPKKAADIYLKLLGDSSEPAVLREALHERLADIYFQAEDKTNAMKQLEAIVRDNPTRFPRAWFFLGELSYEDGKLAEAADDFENALQWDPALEQAYYELALVEIDLHRTTDAFRTLDLARAKFPKTFSGEFYTGVAYAHVKNFTEAMNHFEAAELIAGATDPKLLDYRFYFQFGAACERNQKFKRADEYLQKSVTLNPQFSEGMNYLGYMLADRNEQLPRARALIEKALQIEPKNGAYLDSLGWVLFKQNQPQQALPLLLKAEELSPEPDATVLDHLGEVYRALHQTGKAIESWKKSLSIESNADIQKKLELYSGGT